MSYGVLVGADQKQEWMLPWWWWHFSSVNFDCSVAFADFGMSESARRWCEERGQLVFIPNSPALEEPHREDVRTSWEKKWEHQGEKGNLWAFRKAIFKKPSALLASPFHRTLWLDLDCQVRQDLSPLFSFPIFSLKLSAASWEENICLDEHGKKIAAYPQYNSGVLLYEKDSLLLHLWAKTVQEEGMRAQYDDDLLSSLIKVVGQSEMSLPLIYNWDPFLWGESEDACIYHWIGSKGKKQIAAECDKKSISIHLQ
jgi:hypothetical protein